VPLGLYLPIDDPGNLWATFVRTIVRRYAGRIDHWIVWNEPDIAPGEYGVQWEGSVADFVQLTKVAYLVARQENPNVVIHFAGLTYWHDVVNGRPLYLQRYLDAAREDPDAAAHNYFFDAISLHIYFTTDSVYDITAEFAALLRRNGLSQPIWINETNAPPFDDPLNPWTIPDWKVTLDQQAGFIVQAFAQGLAAGAERVAVYKLIDFPPYPLGYEPYGLVRADGVRRPAYEAMRAVVGHFAGVRSAQMDRTAARSIVTLDRGGQTTRVLWARGKNRVAVSLPALAPQALLVSHLGETQTITPTDGVYRLTLPGALCADPLHGCAVGGAPLILVEDATVDAVFQPQVTFAPTPTATPSPTATLAPSPVPSETPTLAPTATASPTPKPTQQPVPQTTEGLSSVLRLIALTLASGIILVSWALKRRKHGRNAV
jgi:cell division septation protein DedD